MNYRRLAAAALAAAVAACFALLALQLKTTAELPRVSEHYLAYGPEETGAVNIVAAVLLDYRAFDTLGETMVILSAAMAVGALLGSGRLPPSGRGLSVLVRRGIAFLTSAFWLLPIYIIVHGHLSPGGGFQGGVGLTALLVLLTVVYGAGLLPRLLPPRRLATMEYLAALAFLLVGCYGLWRAGAFLGNRVAGFPLGFPGTIFSAGSMPLLNLVIGVKVMAGLGTIFFHLQRDEEPVE